MVRRFFTLTMSTILLAGVLCAGLARAADTPTVNETYEITVNDVGDAAVSDTIKYSKEDYAAVKKVNEKKRTFLTRRFITEDSTGEMADFKTKTDDATSSIIITYSKPGLAYNEKGEFKLYGYSEKPKSESGNKFTFEETSTVNSEFTLFEDQVFKTTTVITLPANASNARYDEGDKAVKYQMPPARTLYGFLSEQKTLMSIVLAVLCLLFAGLLGFVYTRKPLEPAVAGLPVAPPGAHPGHNFCENCGTRVDAGKRFCENCGTKLD